MEEKNFIKFEFTTRDVLDSFDLFMINEKHKKDRYYLDEIITEFLQYIKKDLDYDEITNKQCLSYMKKILFKNERYLLEHYGEDWRR